MPGRSDLAAPLVALSYRVIGEWWRHLRSRRELENLDGSILRDIGSPRGEAKFEAPRPLWMIGSIAPAGDYSTNAL
jgi:uncharacterized protein YjiS (DUF1127 family)